MRPTQLTTACETKQIMTAILETVLLGNITLPSISASHKLHIAQTCKACGSSYCSNVHGNILGPRALLFCA